jgi:hypothetical protein
MDTSKTLSYINAAGLLNLIEMMSEFAVGLSRSNTTLAIPTLTPSYVTVTELETTAVLKIKVFLLIAP